MKRSNFFKTLTLSFCLIIFGFSAGCSNNDNNSSSGGGGGVNPVAFQALLGDTFSDPRCINCHGFDGGNAVAANHDAAGRSDDCLTACHGDIVSTWRAPFRSFTLTGISLSQICTAIKNKTSNDLNLLRDHMITSPHVKWAVSDGALPSGGSVPPAPPGNHGAWIALVNTWIDNGAICD